jgi:hypothetical protein
MLNLLRKECLGSQRGKRRIILKCILDKLVLRTKHRLNWLSIVPNVGFSVRSVDPSGSVITTARLNMASTGPSLLASDSRAVTPFLLVMSATEITTVTP